MNKHIMIIVALVAIVLPISMAAAAVLWERRQRRLQGRRSPIKEQGL